MNLSNTRITEYKYQRTYLRKDGTQREFIQSIQYKPRPPKYSEEQINEMHKRFNMGVSKRRICADFGICCVTLNRILKLNAA